jgi:hypothetical protein
MEYVEPEKPKEKSKEKDDMIKRKSRSKTSFFKEYSKSAHQFSIDSDTSAEERKMPPRSDSALTPKKNKDKR